MNEDDDLQQMFDAQRTIDKELAPAFEDLGRPSQTSHDVSLDADCERIATRKRTKLRIALAVSAIAASVLFGVLAFRGLPPAAKPHAASTTPADLRELNRVCDSVLVAIQESEFAASPPLPQDVGEEMDWPRGTNSLMPFDTFAFHNRTSP